MGATLLPGFARGTFGSYISVMTTHRFTAAVWHNVLGTLPAALTVASGDTVITETLDAHGIDKDGVAARIGAKSDERANLRNRRRAR